MKNLYLNSFAGVLALACLLGHTEKTGAQEQTPVISRPFNERAVYEELFEPRASAPKKDALNRITKILAFFEGYEQEAEEPTEKYLKTPFLERLVTNFEKNLDENEMFISSIEAEDAVKSRKFLYDSQLADSLAKTLVERDLFAKFLDRLIRKTQKTTSVSYSGREFKTKTGLILDEEAGVYWNFQYKKLNFNLAGSNYGIRAGLSLSLGDKCRAHIGAEKNYAVARIKLKF